MKRHIIKTPTAELLIVELPRLCDYHASSRKLWVKDTQSGKELIMKGSWDVLGKPDEIREEYARELVESDEISDVEDYRYQITFIDYKDEENSFPTAKESILSLLESEIYWDVNPLGIYEPIENFQSSTFGGEKTTIYRNPMNVLWHEAESRTFDKNRTLIFVKN